LAHIKADPIYLKAMFLNFLKTALRYLQKNLPFTVINVIGLTAGISAFLMIALFIQNELSYDKHIPGSGNLYRLVGLQEPSGLDKQHVAITSGGWAGFIQENIPEVEEVFRIMWASGTIEVENEFYYQSCYYSEGRMAERLGFPFLSGGDPADMLKQPNTAVISRVAALRMYNSEEVVGATFRHGDRPYTITGVFENENMLSHLNFNVILSLSTVEHESPWLQALGNNSLVTYLALRTEASRENVENIINEHYENLRTGASEQRFMKNTFYLQNVEDIYLRSQHLKFQMIHRQGNITTVYIFILVAMLILGIACINFINLATANSVKRAREVGVRKVLGASRGKLALQFIGESMILTLGALLLSLVLVELMIPEFNSLLGTELKVNFISNPLFNIGLLAILIVVGLVSGLYPGMVLSKFQATEVLKASSGSGRPQVAWLRKVLVTMQFAVSTVLIVFTIVVINQTGYMQTRDRGYDPDQVVFLRFPNEATHDQMETFRQYLLSFPEVEGAAIASNYNGVAGTQSDIVVADSIETRLMARYGYVDPDFFPTMGIEIVRGRNFSRESGTDVYQSILINEATWRALGWEEPLGQRIRNMFHEDYDFYTVVGVIRDYNYYSLHQPIEPAVYFIRPDDMLTMNIRFSTPDSQTFIAKLEREYKRFFPGHVFSGRMVNDVLANETRSEENLMKIFLWFTVLCIVISCLGLFGLTSFMMNQRRKEISIRKVLGSTVTQVNILLMSTFLKLVGLAVLVATPAAWIIMNRWLDNYPYRISLGVHHFAFALLIILAIASSTVLFYSTKAARQNPADHLKYE
jgi:putative ABC transport system permease protein